MSRPKIRTFLSIQAAVLVVGAVLVSGSGAATSGSAAFTDPAGDAQGGPDVTRVAITGDAASGSLAFTVTAGALDAPISEGIDREVWIWLDTDSNSSTGDPEDGTEYGLGAWNNTAGGWWNLVRWSGTAWESLPPSPTVRVTGLGGTVTWALRTSDLGGATRFKLYAFAGAWNVAAERYDTRDEAPDVGWWSYDISAPTQTPNAPTTEVSLTVRTPTTAPRAPVAGKLLTVTFPVEFFKTKTATLVDPLSGEQREVMSVSWEPVRTGKYAGTIAAAGRSIARSGSVRNGQVRLSFVVPRAAAGKVLRVALKVTATDREAAKTVTTTKVVRFRVR